MGNKVGNKKRPLLKVLILGLSGSGKSTFAKQMKIIHSGGFTNEEVITYRDVLLHNILTGMKELVKQAEKLDHSISTENRKYARFFLEKISHDIDSIDWNENLFKKIQMLWADPAIQETWRDASLYQLQVHHMDYMIENVNRFKKKDFVPTNEDILYARQRTTGSTLIRFKKDKYKWELTDVGGQVPERAKWEKIVEEGSHAVIYFAGLDEYNMISLEDRTKTKMEVSLQVFAEILNSEKMKGMCLLLFLNKLDLLEKKVKDKQHFAAFKKAFPDYKGPANTQDVCNHIQNKFLSLDPDREINTHVICALNTDSMATVFDAVKENIFMKRMENLTLSNNFQ